VSELTNEKIFYERFFALHHDAQLIEVVKAFGIGVFRRSSVLEGFATFLDETNFRGERCVEIGTCNGLTAVVLARHFDEVVTIDVVPSDVKRGIAKHLGVKNIRFVDVRDNAEKAAAIEMLHFDGAYVDGDHAHDTEADFALVKHAGRVLFHEYWPAQPAVVALVERLRLQGRVVTQGKLALWMI